MNFIYIKRRVLLLCSVVLISIAIIAGFNLMPTSSTDAKGTPVTIHSRYTSQLDRLAAILSKDDLTFDESKLLSESHASSRIALVRLDPEEAAASNAEFLPEPLRTAQASLLEIQNEKGPIRRQRSLELSPNQILVVAAGRLNEVLWWQLLPDPRVLHAETSDASGAMSGGVLYRRSVEMLVPFPSAAAVSELRLYHCEWDGNTYELQSLGTVPVN